MMPTENDRYHRLLNRLAAKESKAARPAKEPAPDRVIEADHLKEEFDQLVDDFTRRDPDARPSLRRGARPER